MKKYNESILGLRVVKVYDKIFDYVMTPKTCYQHDKCTNLTSNKSENVRLVKFKRVVV